MVTTVLELVGSLILIVAGVIFLWPYSVPGALAVAGVALICLSRLMTVLANRRHQ